MPVTTGLRIFWRSIKSAVPRVIPWSVAAAAPADEEEDEEIEISSKHHFFPGYVVGAVFENDNSILCPSEQLKKYDTCCDSEMFDFLFRLSTELHNRDAHERAPQLMINKFYRLINNWYHVETKRTVQQYGTYKKDVSYNPDFLPTQRLVDGIDMTRVIHAIEHYCCFENTKTIKYLYKHYVSIVNDIKCFFKESTPTLRLQNRLLLCIPTPITRACDDLTTEEKDEMNAYGRTTVAGRIRDQPERTEYYYSRSFDIIDHFDMNMPYHDLNHELGRYKIDPTQWRDDKQMFGSQLLNYNRMSRPYRNVPP